MQIETTSLADAEKMFSSLTSKYFKEYPLTIIKSRNRFAIVGVQDGDNSKTAETATQLLSDARVALVLVINTCSSISEPFWQNHIKIYDKAFKSLGYTFINIDGTPYEPNGAKLYGMLHPGLLY